MKKQRVLELLPKFKELKTALREKEKSRTKLDKEIGELWGIVDSLENVTLHGDFPVEVRRAGDEIEVFAGCDEVKRYAYIQQRTDGTCSAKGFRSEDEMDGTALADGVKAKAALQIAKDYVATGKIAGPVETPKRGRPKKAA